jgi:hypothetical protein
MNKQKKKLLKLSLLASLLTSFSPFYKYEHDEILLLSTDKAIDIMEDINGFAGTTFNSYKTQNVRKQLYCMGITDHKEYESRCEEIISYWDNYKQTNKFKKIKHEWGSLSINNRKDALEEINRDFIKSFPVLQENNIQHKLKLLDENSRVAAEIETSPLKFTKKYIFINNRLLKEDEIDMSLSFLLHELSHGLDYSKINVYGVQSNYDKLLLSSRGFMNKGYKLISNEYKKTNDEECKIAYKNCPPELLPINIQKILDGEMTSSNPKLYSKKLNKTLHANHKFESFKRIQELNNEEFEKALEDEIITTNEVNRIIAKRKTSLKR